MTLDPTGFTAEFTALLGSRICHDIISPLGAIGNGIELLELSGADGPEIALIREAVADANRRIRFFRVAFGAARDGQVIGADEIAEMLPQAEGRRALTIDWQAEGDQPRQAVKRAFLALMCLETSMPYGGAVEVRRDGDDWRLTGRAERLNPAPELWQMLNGHRPEPLPAAAHLHFALLAVELQAGGIMPAVALEPDGITLTYPSGAPA